MQKTATIKRGIRTLAIFAASFFAIVAVILSRPQTARGETIEELEQRVEETSASYNEASEKVATIEDEIAENQSRIEEIQQQLPAIREQAASCIRAQYKLQQGSQGLLDLVLSSDDFYDFLETVEFLDSITSYNNEQIDELVSLTNELNQAQADLNTQLETAEAEKQEAAEALEAAQQAREELQQQQEAEAEAEAAEAQAALEAAQQSAGDTFTTESGNTATVEVPSSSSSTSSDTSSTSSDTSSSTSDTSSSSTNTSNSYTASGVDWNVDKETFIATWTARINAYLAGSPLAGHGATFAEAAWTYGIDPRLSPAISNVESSKGLYCFRPYNAWGWGNASWSDWDTAIWAHVSGLARNYDHYLTYAMAKKYCPPNAAAWYSSVAANIQQI